MNFLNLSGSLICVISLLIFVGKIVWCVLLFVCTFTFHLKIKQEDNSMSIIVHYTECTLAIECSVILWNVKKRQIYIYNVIHLTVKYRIEV
jgi:nitric oxide reductase large subunit